MREEEIMFYIRMNMKEVQSTCQKETNISNDMKCWTSISFSELNCKCHLISYDEKGRLNFVD